MPKLRYASRLFGQPFSPHLATLLTLYIFILWLFTIVTALAVAVVVVVVFRSWLFGAFGFCAVDQQQRLLVVLLVCLWLLCVVEFLTTYAASSPSLARTQLPLQTTPLLCIESLLGTAKAFRRKLVLIYFRSLLVSHTLSLSLSLCAWRSLSCVSESGFVWHLKVRYK